MTLNELNTLTAESFIETFGSIYEHSPWVAEGVAPLRPFPTRAALISAMQEWVDRATDDQKLALIRAHPDLAGKLARAGKLTAESTREQAGLGLDRLSEDEYERFTSLNTAYRERFGFPFIICARKHTRASVLEAFERRLEHDEASEIGEAIRQIHDIARLRLHDAVEE
ncbi:2-oxo-4-hydroxy-4-carboxy-5-ureidoimidazoline decarboxylase [Haloferula sargassicola]|uniref:2-oxo-4-hydroxy-4-carboxy-5-ureidoimidazoline decarboxylase n=1 Tax=Haloferula sargassicola TaxID=490096 RepID=A0ABP9UQR7_9BACT